MDFDRLGELDSFQRIHQYLATEGQAAGHAHGGDGLSA
jgi:hypothetical protein